MSPYMSFDTQRLTLRPLEYADAAMILALNLDPDWQKYIGDRGVYDLESAKYYIENGPKHMYRQFGFGVLAVRVNETGEFVGTCGLLKREKLSSPDIGFAFLPSARGKGFALEACRGLIAQIQVHRDWHYIEALVTPENKASIALLTKLGFEFQQNLPHFEPDKDTDLYRLSF